MSEPAVLQVKGLTKHFGPLTAVDDLSFELQEGEVLGLLGPNGAGKTTTIRMICGLLRPDAGQVHYQGQPMDAAARHRVGVCPQEIILWERLTCLEQLVHMGQMYDLPARLALQRALALLKVVELTERGDSQARTLSGGMQRRLNLIMALVHDPDILVLDEPEAGLDPQSRLLVRAYIKSLADTKTVVLTTHNMDEADRLADRVAIIDHGRLLTLDTPAALKRGVGQGDVLEIDLPEGSTDPTWQERARTAVEPLVRDATVAGSTLLLRALGVVELLPALLDALAAAGVSPGEVRLRENTLEDVFIALTGRRLRE